uniref:Bridge-like lipid transfer protein family member 3A n=1 Tax=Labrus bergylta TaxID=56723 RepID=A0A3Q3EYB2_9LABR
MAGIIKKQILKHLSRFTKNLSPDKINLSTLKGEGQLSNLELDEEVLQNMLDLPTWLAVTRVYCNRAAIRIQWTKLKTSPICLFLDKVEVEMRTCEEPRPPNGPSPIAITEGQSEYGFAEKVVEGMSVRINSITIKVQSRAFHASFELWQLQGNSLNPKWQRSDLRYTRVTDPKRGEVLTFKEINWQSLRIEADAIESDDQDLGSTPLRLITNQGRIRIALKRRLKDCNVLASKLLFILDDLLWVLTDSQLKAIIHYSKSLSEAMEKSAQQRKSRTTAPPSPGLHNIWADPPPAPTGPPNTTSQYFDLYDVKESSYHTFISRLDLHICNDSSSLDEGQLGRQNKKTQSLLSCNRKSLRLPDNVPAVHLQLTEYYFPDNPIPTTNLYAQLNGLQLCVDPASVLWINLFSRGLLHTLDQVKAFYHLQDSSKAEEHVDICMDATQLKTKECIFNTPHCPNGSRADLNSTFNKFASCPFFHTAPPCPYPRDRSAFHPVPSIFLQLSQETEPLPLDIKRLRSQDIWSLSLSRKTQPFVEPFAMSVWICQPSAFGNNSPSSSSSPSRDHHASPEQEDTSLASFHFLAHTITPVKMWLNHYQYVALLRMRDTMARLGAELGRDLRDVKQAHGQKTKPSTVCLALLVDSAELGLLLPAVCSEPEGEVAHTPETDSPSITDSDMSPTHRSEGVPEENGLESAVSINTANENNYQDEQGGMVEEACEASSVLVLILSGTACTMEVKGEDQVVAVETNNLTPVQMGNIRVADLHAGLIQGAPAVCMRSEMGPSAARHSALAESLGFLDIRMQDFQAELLASTVSNIGPFLEDEFSVDSQPMQLHLSNVTVTIKDDSPKIYPTAPQPVPASFVVDKLLLERGEDGMMRLKGEKNNCLIILHEACAPFFKRYASQLCR